MAAFDSNMVGTMTAWMRSTMTCDTTMLGQSLSSLQMHKNKTHVSHARRSLSHSVAAHAAYKPVECLEPDPADPDELPGLSRPGDCVKSIPK